MVYVDDLIITGNHSFEIENLKNKMQFEFEMTDLGKLSYFLGMKLVKVEEIMVMCQQNYVNELLDVFE